MIDRKVIAHRFGAGLGPESTLAALNESLKLGVTWVEFDASLLKDGTVIVFHDDTFNRCTDGEGKLSDKTWEAVQQMSYLHKKFKSEKILELGQALEILNQHGLKINLEIKVNGSEEKELVEAVHALTKKVWARPDDLIFSSFNHKALLHLRTLDDQAPIAHLFENLPSDWQKQAEAVSAISIHIDAKIEDDKINQIKQAKYPLYAYTVNTLSKAESLFAKGVDGVFTDQPNIFPADWR
jgi:glycerophosphoryl diester phosphodiesterase